MARLSAELLEAAARLGFGVERLAPENANALRQRIAKTFSLDPKYLLTAHHDVKFESIHNPAAWSWVSDFLDQSEVYLLFDWSHDPDVLRIPSGTMVVPLLGETTGFVFCLAPPDDSYLLCFDDHDCLMGVGKAADWIRQRKSKA